MRILLLGATGMIGAALARTILAGDHALIVGARNVEDARRRWPKASVAWIDFTDARMADAWPQVLQGVDVVVNAVGIFSERGRQTFDAIHVDGPVRMFEIAAALGTRVVQISALGADAGSRFAYMASKGRAEAALTRLAGSHAIVRPSLVFSPEGESTRAFAALAALPVTPLPGGGKQRIQPIHVDDLCELVVRLLDDTRARMTVDAVGPDAIALRDYLQAFKASLRLGGVFMPVPMGVSRAFAGIAERFVPLASPDALAMLEAGNIGDPTALTRMIGRAPRAPSQFFDDTTRAMLRRDAQLAWLLPLLRTAVAITWIVTGVVSAFVYPVHESLALLARTGIDGASALLALYGAAALDVALGATTFVARLRSWSYRAQFILILFYSVVITLCLPEYWAHPYGPILKNVPLLAAIALLLALDDAHGPDRR